MPKVKRLMYRGITKDITYNPWLRLVHGTRYDVEKIVMPSGKIRANVSNGMDRARIFYDDNNAFKRDWAK